MHMTPSKADRKKIKYIKVIADGEILWGKENLSKEDLIRARSSGDKIINIEDVTSYNAEENKWEEIKHD